MSNNPYGASMPEMGGGSFEAARQKMTGPAIALIAVGAINIVYALYSVFSSLLFMAGVNPMAAAQQAQLE
jgi:hypothetical protein